MPLKPLQRLKVVLRYVYELRAHFIEGSSLLEHLVLQTKDQNEHPDSWKTTFCTHYRATFTDYVQGASSNPICVRETDAKLIS